jgi:hypothetical protein
MEDISRTAPHRNRDLQSEVDTSEKPMPIPNGFGYRLFSEQVKKPFPAA